MSGFDKTEQIVLRKMITHSAWTNTALLSIILAEAFYDHRETDFYIGVVALFLTWSIYRMQRRELDRDIRWLFTFLNIAQNAIMVYTAFGIGRVIYRFFALLEFAL